MICLSETDYSAAILTYGSGGAIVIVFSGSVVCLSEAEYLTAVYAVVSGGAIVIVFSGSVTQRCNNSTLSYNSATIGANKISILAFILTSSCFLADLYNIVILGSETKCSAALYAVGSGGAIAVIFSCSVTQSIDRGTFSDNSAANVANSVSFLTGILTGCCDLAGLYGGMSPCAIYSYLTANGAKDISGAIAVIFSCSVTQSFDRGTFSDNSAANGANGVSFLTGVLAGSRYLVGLYGGMSPCASYCYLVALGALDVSSAIAIIGFRSMRGSGLKRTALRLFLIAYRATISRHTVLIEVNEIMCCLSCDYDLIAIFICTLNRSGAVAVIFSCSVTVLVWNYGFAAVFTVNGSGAVAVILCVCMLAHCFAAVVHAFALYPVMGIGRNDLSTAIGALNSRGAIVVIICVQMITRKTTAIIGALAVVPCMLFCFCSNEHFAASDASGCGGAIVVVLRGSVTGSLSGNNIISDDSTVIGLFLAPHLYCSLKGNIFDTVIFAGKRLSFYSLLDITVAGIRTAFTGRSALGAGPSMLIGRIILITRFPRYRTISIYKFMYGNSAIIALAICVAIFTGKQTAIGTAIRATHPMFAFFFFVDKPNHLVSQRIGIAVGLAAYIADSLIGAGGSAALVLSAFCSAHNILTNCRYVDRVGALAFYPVMVIELAKRKQGTASFAIFRAEKAGGCKYVILMITLCTANLACTAIHIVSKVMPIIRGSFLIGAIGAHNCSGAIAVILCVQMITRKTTASISAPSISAPNMLICCGSDHFTAIKALIFGETIAVNISPLMIAYYGNYFITTFTVVMTTILKLVVLVCTGVFAGFLARTAFFGMHTIYKIIAVCCPVTLAVFFCMCVVMCCRSRNDRKDHCQQHNPSKNLSIHVVFSYKSSRNLQQNCYVAESTLVPFPHSASGNKTLS